MRNRGFLLAAIAAAMASAAPAQAAVQWQASETLSASANPLSLGPDGTGLLFSLPNLAIRPLGGPTGSQQQLPAPMGTQGGSPVVGWFPDGSSLISDPSTDRIAYRPAGAGAAVGTPQDLGSGNGATAIATVASGDAIVGFDGASVGPAAVAFRSAGASAAVDIAHKQTFGPDTGRLIGVALDPNGGAVVVWIDTSNGPNGGALYQAVRDPGTASFKNAVQIPAPHPYQVRMAEDSSGYALLSWSDGAADNVVMASLRAPGQAFGAPATISTEPDTGGGISVLPAITSTGDALIAWDGGFVSHCTAYGNGNDSDFGAFTAREHLGSWGAPVPLASSTWPVVSTVDAVASAGNTVAVAYETRSDHDGQCQAPLDDSTDSFVVTGTAGASGISFDGPHAIASGVPLPNDSYHRYYNPSVTAMSVNPLGGVLYEYGQYVSGSPVTYLVPREDRGMTGGGGGGGTGGGGGGTGGGGTGGGGTGGGGTGGGGTGGGGTGGGKVLPIVPHDVIVPASISPVRPFVTVTCPPAVADECAFRVGVYLAFGAIPHASESAARKLHKLKKATLIGTGAVVVRPGKRAKLKLSLTTAGRKAVRTGHSIKVRIKLTLKYNGHLTTFTINDTVAARRKPTKHR